MDDDKAAASLNAETGLPALSAEEAEKGGKTMKCVLFLGPLIGSIIGVGFALMIHYVGNTRMFDTQIAALAGLT